jgi:hypothetical protein
MESEGLHGCCVKTNCKQTVSFAVVECIIDVRVEVSSSRFQKKCGAPSADQWHPLFGRTGECFRLRTEPAQKVSCVLCTSSAVQFTTSCFQLGVAAGMREVAQHDMLCMHRNAPSQYTCSRTNSVHSRTDSGTAQAPASSAPTVWKLGADKGTITGRSVLQARRAFCHVERWVVSWAVSTASSRPNCGGEGVAKPWSCALLHFEGEAPTNEKVPEAVCMNGG